MTMAKNLKELQEKMPREARQIRRGHAETVPVTERA